MPPEERIAIFDNDGTLWSEQPSYIQLARLEEYLLFRQVMREGKTVSSDEGEWQVRSCEGVGFQVSEFRFQSMRGLFTSETRHLKKE